MFFNPIITEQDIAKLEADKISYETGVTFSSLASRHAESFNMLWNNPNSSTQAILDVYGCEAVKLFYLSKVTQDFLLFLNPNYVYLHPPKDIIINPDGTVTVIEPVIEPEPIVEPPQELETEPELGTPIEESI